MPRGDKTGPMSMGSMTGRRMGLCSGNDRPGYMNGRQQGGISHRGGHGFRNILYATGLPCWMRNTENIPEERIPNNELEMLKSRAEFFEKQRTMILESIQRLEKDMS